MSEGNFEVALELTANVRPVAEALNQTMANLAAFTNKFTEKLESISEKLEKTIQSRQKDVEDTVKKSQTIVTKILEENAKQQLKLIENRYEREQAIAQAAHNQKVALIRENIKDEEEAEKAILELAKTYRAQITTIYKAAQDEQTKLREEAKAKQEQIDAKAAAAAKRLQEEQDRLAEESARRVAQVRKQIEDEQDKSVRERYARQAAQAQTASNRRIEILKKELKEGEQLDNLLIANKKALNARLVRIAEESALAQRKANERAENQRRESMRRGLLGVGFAAGVVGAGVGGELKNQVDAAREFDKNMRNVDSIAKFTTQQLQDNSRAILEMTRAVPESAANLSKGLYQFYSSAFEGKEALEGTEIAAKGAAAGLSTTDEAAKVLIQTANAYNMKSGPEMNYIMDVLFQTVNKGIVEFPQLAQSFGEVTSMGKAAGLSLAELGAALSVITLRGLSPSEGITALNSLITHMITPARDATAAAKQMGEAMEAAGKKNTIWWFNARDAAQHLKEVGLPTALEEIGKATGGNVSKLHQLIPEVRGTRAELKLLMDDAGGMGKAFRDMFEKDFNPQALLGATDLALERQMASFDAKIKLLENAINRVRIALGSGILEFVVPLGQGLAILADAFDALPQPVKAFVGVLEILIGTGIVAIGVITAIGLAMVGLDALIAASTPALGALIAQIGIFNTFMGIGIAGIRLAAGTLLGFLGPLSLVALAVTALYLAWKTNFGSIRDIVADLGNTLVRDLKQWSIDFGIFSTWLQNLWKGTGVSLKNIFYTFLGVLSKLFGIFFDEVGIIFKLGIDVLTGNFGLFFKDLYDNSVRWANNMISLFKGVFEIISQYAKDIDKAQTSEEQASKLELKAHLKKASTAGLSPFSMEYKRITEANKAIPDLSDAERGKLLLKAHDLRSQGMSQREAASANFVATLGSKAEKYNLTSKGRDMVQALSGTGKLKMPYDPNQLNPLAINPHAVYGPPVPDAHPGYKRGELSTAIAEVKDGAINKATGQMDFKKAIDGLENLKKTMGLVGKEAKHVDAEIGKLHAQMAKKSAAAARHAAAEARREMAALRRAERAAHKQQEIETETMLRNIKAYYANHFAFIENLAKGHHAKTKLERVQNLQDENKQLNDLEAALKTKKTEMEKQPGNSSEKARRVGEVQGFILNVERRRATIKGEIEGIKNYLDQYTKVNDMIKELEAKDNDGKVAYKIQKKRDEYAAFNARAIKADVDPATMNTLKKVQTTDIEKDITDAKMQLDDKLEQYEGDAYERRRARRAAEFDNLKLTEAQNADDIVRIEKAKTAALDEMDNEHYEKVLKEFNQHFDRVNKVMENFFKSNTSAWQKFVDIENVAVEAFGQQISAVAILAAQQLGATLLTISMANPIAPLVMGFMAMVAVLSFIGKNLDDYNKRYQEHLRGIAIMDKQNTQNKLQLMQAEHDQTMLNLDEEYNNAVRNGTLTVELQDTIFAKRRQAAYKYAIDLEQFTREREKGLLDAQLTIYEAYGYKTEAVETKYQQDILDIRYRYLDLWRQGLLNAKQYKEALDAADLAAQQKYYSDLYDNQLNGINKIRDLKNNATTIRVAGAQQTVQERLALGIYHKKQGAEAQSIIDQHVNFESINNDMDRAKSLGQAMNNPKLSKDYQIKAQEEYVNAVIELQKREYDAFGKEIEDYKNQVIQTHQDIADQIDYEKAQEEEKVKAEKQDLEITLLGAKQKQDSIQAEIDLLDKNIRKIKEKYDAQRMLYDDQHRQQDLDEFKKFAAGVKSGPDKGIIADGRTIAQQEIPTLRMENGKFQLSNDPTFAGKRVTTSSDDLTFAGLTAQKSLADSQLSGLSISHQQHADEIMQIAAKQFNLAQQGLSQPLLTFEDQVKLNNAVDEAVKMWRDAKLETIDANQAAESYQSTVDKVAKTTELNTVQDQSKGIETELKKIDDDHALTFANFDIRYRKNEANFRESMHRIATGMSPEIQAIVDAYAPIDAKINEMATKAASLVPGMIQQVQSQVTAAANATVPPPSPDEPTLPLAVNGSSVNPSTGQGGYVDSGAFPTTPLSITSANAAPVINNNFLGSNFDPGRLFLGPNAFPGAASGGLVQGGVRGRDSVPILAQHGELIIDNLLTSKLEQFLNGFGRSGGGSTFHFDFSGMTVRNDQDIDTIVSRVSNELARRF